MRRMNTWTKRILCLAAVLVLILSAAWFEGRTAAFAEDPRLEQGEEVLSAGRSKTTPTPKPRKTPRPENAATPTPRPTLTPSPAPEPDRVTPSPVPEGPIIEPQAIADWLFAPGFTLPDNFITKREAQALGWGSKYRDVSDAAPGKSIGGDRFGNYEGLLPRAKGRQYYECDCWYVSGKRNAYRIIFSNDGLVFYTEDHYRTFVEMHPSVPDAESAP